MQGRRRPRRRAVAISVVGLVVAIALGGLVLLAIAGGDRAPGEGALAWLEPPRVLPAPGSARERILTGTVHNRSSARVEFEARRVRVVDAEGRRLPAGATFVAGFVRGVYSGSRLRQEPDSERERTGRVVRLAPGGSRPLTVAWRSEPGRGPAARVEYPGGSLPVPR